MTFRRTCSALSGRAVQCDECGANWFESIPEPPGVPELGAVMPGRADEAMDAPEAYEIADEPVEPLLDEAYAEPEAEPDPLPEPAAPPAPVLEAIDVKSEAARLARASQNAKLAFERNRQERSRTLRGWAMLAGCMALIAAPAVAFPRQVTSLFPGAAQLYAKAGVEVNKRGLEFRKISYKRVLDEGALVLAIEGTVVNVSGGPQPVPPLRIALLDDKKQDLYSWTVKPKTDALAPGGLAKFETRLASPPADSANLQIRFAQPGELVPED